MNEFRLDPRTTIGHVHLKVSDIERAERFYVDLLGFHVTARYGTLDVGNLQVDVANCRAGIEAEFVHT